MNKKTWIVLGVLLGGIFLAFSFFGGVYNQLVASEEGVTSAWAQVENVYQRRLDLVPNLVETVKGYAEHEKETLQGVTDARAKVSQMTITSEVINNPALLEKFQQMQSGLSSALSRLMAVAERYPDLKASQNFLALQTQLEGTENRITVERRRFNEAAQQFNTLRRVFPNIWVANWMGFEAKAYFQANEGAAAAPVVKF